MPVCGQTVRISPAYKDGFGSKTKRFDNIATTPYSAIHKNFYLIVCGRNNFRESSDRWGNAVQLPSAMVGYNNRRRSFVDRMSCVVSCEYSFNEDRAWPEFPQPAKVLPCDYRLGKRRPDVHEGHRTLSGYYDVFEQWYAAIE
jgi:hypothetical protein